MYELLFVLLWMVFAAHAQYSDTSYPVIKGVAAMCSSEGITASVDFDRPFRGKIFSVDYATVHDCVYYNSLDMDTVLFSIPAHRCGTKLSRTSRNIVDQMVNRVYVQMDRDMQTAGDKQFSFVCQLAEGRSNNRSVSIRRHPVSVGRDAYATAPVTSSQNQLSSDPIKPSEVRVAAFSTDNRLGNWPIPGAKPFDLSMQPKPVFPKWPLPEPIQPSTDPKAGSYAQPIPAKTSSHMNDPIKANMQDSYPSGPPIASMTPPTYSHAPPIVPQAPPLRSPPIPSHYTNSLSNSYVRGGSASYSHPNYPGDGYAVAGNDITSSNSHAVGPLPRPVVPLRAPPMTRPLTPPISGQPYKERSPDSYATAASVPPISASEIHLNQGIGMGLQGLDATIATRVPAPTWNMARPPSSSDSVTSSVTSSSPSTRKVFIEEPKRVEFTSDVEGNTVNVHDQSPPAKEQLISTQEHYAPRPEVILEMQMGAGPGTPPISRPVRIGDNITLVVRAATQLKDPKAFDMFVHSCFATDGPGTTKIDLIDDHGCVSRPEFVSPLSRTKDAAGQMIYFFRISAFKFPGPDDVYFSCSIDLTPLRTAPDICPSVSRRRRRSIPSDRLRLFDIVKVELAEKYEKEKKIAADEDLYCATSPLFWAVVLVFSTTLLAFTVSSFIAMSLYFKLTSLRMKY